MADNDYTAKINISSGNMSGAEKAEKAIDRVGAASERASKKAANAAKASTSSFGKLGQGIEKVSSTVGKLNAVITGFGVVGIIMSVINAFKMLYDWLQKDTKAAQDLYKEMEKKSAAEQVERVAEAYKKVSDAIKDTAAERQRENELFSEGLRIKRDAQDAELELAEQKELASVDESSETAAEEKAQISAKYASLRSRNVTNRRKEDIISESLRYLQRANDATAAADAIEATLAGDEKIITRKRLEARTKEALSHERNEKDGTWYNRNKRTEEGDEIRSQQKEEAESARKEADALQKELDRKRKEVESLRKEAARSLTRKEMLGMSLTAADTRQEAAGIQSEMSIQQANQAMAMKNQAIASREEQRERDAAFIAAAPGRRNAIQSRIDAANQSLISAEGAFASERRDVWQAQQNLDIFNMQNAGRRGGSITRRRAALAENVQAEQSEAQAAEAEFQKVRSSVGAILASLKREMAQFEAELKNAQSREKARAEQTGAAE